MKTSIRTRFISGFMSLVLLSLIMLFSAPTSVNAADSESGIVLGTITGHQASSDLKEYLADNNVYVDSDDEISLVDNDGVELQVVSYDSETMVTVHTISGYDEEDEGLIKSDVPFTVSKTRATPSFTNNHKNNTITFRGTVTYTVSDIEIDGYDRAAYRPMSTSFYYTRKSTATVTVTKVESNFRTRGSLYNTSTGNIESLTYNYDITNNVSSPVASRTYSAANSLSSTYRIIYSNGKGEGPLFSYRLYFSDGTSDGVDSYPMK